MSIARMIDTDVLSLSGSLAYGAKQMCNTQIHARWWWSYRWQLGMLPFFVASLSIALAIDITDRRIEFIGISVLYALGDVLMVHAFAATRMSARAKAQGCAMLIFGSVFLYTWIAHGEAEYILAQPLFWIAGWKRISSELLPSWYPHALNTRIVVALTACILIVSVLVFTYTDLVPSTINFLQVIGLCAFGSMLAADNETRLHARIGTIGLWVFTLSCAGDVVHKYMFVGHIIATPLVAFFASLPVAIVASRNMIRMR